MKFFALVPLLLLPFATASPAADPADAVAPAATPSEKPPVSYDGRRLLFQKSFSKCMFAKGRWDGAKVGLSQDCNNEKPNMLWDTGAPGTVGDIRLTGTNLCLDAGDWDSRGNGRRITLRTCGEGAQSWWYSNNGRVELAGPVPRAHSAPPKSGYCLDLTDGDPNKQLQIWTCYDGNQNQVWDLPPWCRFC